MAQDRPASSAPMESALPPRVPGSCMRMVRTRASPSLVRRPGALRQWRASRFAMSETRVLIVDDEPLARDVIRGLLSRLDGVTVVGECGDGVRAIDAVRTLEPDIVFLDVQMPDL